MTPAAFIEKWSLSELRERQGSQSHFNDLCALLGEPNPTDADPLGTSYCFERGASKVGGGDGWADVWRRGCFGWEYKGKHKDLNAALRQLQIYIPDLENPPYLVVCDMERIVVHTNWTNTVRKIYSYELEDLREPSRLDELRHVFHGSEALKPGLSPQELTAKVAERFGDLGRRLQERKHDPQAVAHFLNRLIFCFFAEDAEILPRGLVTRLLRALQLRPTQAKPQLDALFSIMRGGGFFGADVVRWFNGGLFDDAQALPLDQDDLKLLANTAAEHDWSNIDPAVFGTMFEEALKTTGRRGALGAHYTDREMILKVVEPVVIRPLAAEWETALCAIRAEADAMAAADVERKVVQEQAAAAMVAGAAAYQAGEAARRKTLTAIARRRSLALGRATEIRDAFLARLSAFRVLDPACGSGNFLYVALHALRDIELRALLDADRLGVPQVPPRVGLDAVRGIEIEAYAAELARVTLWIGNLQWERRNGYTAYAEPILHALDTIEHRDALLNSDGSETAWPEANVIIGNPPFLGRTRYGNNIDEEQLLKIRKAFDGRVPASANFVTYWFEKSLRLLENREIDFVGLVATQAIRRGVTNSVLRNYQGKLFIYDALSNEPWSDKGTAIRVSIASFSWEKPKFCYLDGHNVDYINSDLTSDTASNLPKVICENIYIAFQGTISGGPFEITGEQARILLLSPLNPNEQSNALVVKPWINADDIAGRRSDFWIIDFGDRLTEQEAALYVAPFRMLKKAWEIEKERRLKAGERPLRQNEPRSLANWWIIQRRRSSSLKSIAKRKRVVITPRVSKHRYFVWMDTRIVPDTRIVVFDREDDTFFGILSSRIHEIWSIRFGGRHGVGNDPEYIHTLTFNTFPFPDELTPNIDEKEYCENIYAKAIAEAASELNRLRENWLNPADLIIIEEEVVPGYPDRVIPKDATAAQVLKTRTLTDLYNARDPWLCDAHRRLDEAVAAAYGWPVDLSDDEILARLFALNQERAAAGR